jgi:hypothetical protein
MAIQFSIKRCLLELYCEIAAEAIVTLIPYNKPQRIYRVTSKVAPNHRENMLDPQRSYPAVQTWAK